MADVHYQNITISGGVAVGNSTLRENLKPYLLPKKWRFFSGGEMLRKIAIQKGVFSEKNTLHHFASLYDDSVDTKFDAEIERKLRDEKHIVIESWLSGFFSRDMPHVMRVLLTCDNEKIHIDRFINRDNVPLHDAKKLLYERETDNFKKWERLYGTYDFFDKKYYTIVIDTALYSPLETTEIVLNKLGYK